MFGGVNVWQIVELKVIGEIIISEWIDFGHKDTIYKLKFDWSKFAITGDLPILPNFSAAKHSCHTVPIMQVHWLLP